MGAEVLTKRRVRVGRADLGEALRRVGESVMVTTTFGAGFGALLGYMRAQPILLYSVSMGANYALFSGTFFGACARAYRGSGRRKGWHGVGGWARRGVWRAVVREALMLVDPTVPRRNSALAGSVTGGLLTTIFAGATKGVQGAVLWGGVCLLGQMAWDQVDEARSRHLARVLERRKARLQSDESTATLDSELEHMAQNPPSSLPPPATYGEILPSARDIGRGSLRELMPSWLPFGFLTEEEYEAKLRRRLRLLDDAIARDDAFRAMIESQVHDYDSKGAKKTPSRAQ